MNENRTNIWPAVIFTAATTIIICCAAAPDTTTLMIVLLVLGALTALAVLFKWGAVTGAKASGDPAKVNALRIRRTVIIAIITIIAVYTAVTITYNKINWYDRSYQDYFTPWIPALAAALALVAYALFSVISRYAKNKKEAEAKHMEELMNTPLKKFSDREDRAERLKNNYDDDPSNDVKL